MEEFGGFADLLATRAHRTPEAACLLVGDGDRVTTVTWEDFDARVTARARELAGAGAACEAVLATGGIDCLVEAFACVAAELQCALINPFEADEEARRLIAACDADALWAPARRRAALAGALRTGPAPGRVRPRQVLFFTSGTTARAKAVALTDASLMASAWRGASMLPLSASDRLLAALPLSHVFGFVCGVLWGMQCGCPVALGRGMRRFESDFALFEPTAVSLVPTLARWALDRNVLGQSVRLVLAGAAPCPPDVVRDLRKQGIRLCCGYGLTETSSGVALSLGDDPHAMTVCPRTQVRISADGEVIVRAPGSLMRGYYGQADTAPVDGWLATGDAGRIDDAGLLHVSGRLKDVAVLSNGTKLFIPDYERALKRALGEEDLAVIACNGAPVLVCGALARHQGATERDIERELAPVLARYPRESQVAHTVLLGHALPRTAAGDVRRWSIQKEVEKCQPKKK
jgi:long-subunit acyl-CoA synthetase (AMP-forming)